ncbi:MAG: ral secretion pathway protein [Deferribacteraceae bacterium]|nr:ral secretion pathway protein [Deferribacteraceae bacterium]
MSIKSVLMFVAISIISVASAYFISKYVEYKYYVPVSSKISFESKTPVNSSKRYDIEDIVKINPFKLDVSEEKSANVLQEDAKQNTADVAVTDNLKALGYTDENGLILALIMLNDKAYVFSSEKEVEGYTIEYVENDILVLNKNGKRVELKLEKGKSGIGAPSKIISTNGSNSASSLNYKVKRSDVEAQLKDINSLIRTVFISPYYNKNEFIGYRISRMASDSILRKIGINPGDVIVRINGDSVENPQKMMELLGKISDVTAVSIDILRRGQKKSVFVEID